VTETQYTPSQELKDAIQNAAYGLSYIQKAGELADKEGIPKKLVGIWIKEALKQRGLSDPTIRRMLPPDFKEESRVRLQSRVSAIDAKKPPEESDIAPTPTKHVIEVKEELSLSESPVQVTKIPAVTQDGWKPPLAQVVTAGPAEGIRIAELEAQVTALKDENLGLIAKLGEKDKEIEELKAASNENKPVKIILKPSDIPDDLFIKRLSNVLVVKIDEMGQRSIYTVGSKSA